MAKIIAIAGPPSGGKQQFAQALAKTLGPATFVYVLQRDYCLLTPQQMKNPHRINYDIPEAFDLEMAFRAIQGLRQGRHEVFLNTYDRQRGMRTMKERVVIGPTKPYQRPTGPTLLYPSLEYVIVVGLYALHPTLVPLVDVGVFWDMNMEWCLERRIARDREVFGMEEARVLTYWNRNILPAYYTSLLPTAMQAHHVISWSEEVYERSIALICGQVGANPGLSYLV